MLEIVESASPIFAADNSRIEDVIGRPFPDSYRAFLLANNGGRPKPDLIDIQGAEFKGTSISVFHGINDPTECNDLLWNLDILEGCKENKLLPIATDGYGYLFMIDLSAERYGEVLYFDSAEIPPRPYHVANDFNEFLGKIRD